MISSKNCPEYLPYVVTWESELEQMCGQANFFGNIETGGECYGLFSHGGRPVIMLATPAGPNAIHQSAHFRQDISFLEETNQYLVEECGLNFLGSHHSHHTLGIDGLSRGDIKSTNAIATKNGYSQMCQILITFSQLSNSVPGNLNRNAYRHVNQNLNGNLHPFGWGRCSFHKKFTNEPTNKRQFNYKIKIHTYIYSDAQSGEPIKCSLKVIPGFSPYRTSIMYSSKMPGLHHFYRFPISNMTFDSLDRQKNSIKDENCLPQEILASINTLPETILEKLQLSIINELLFITFPIEDDSKHLSVVYQTIPPYSVKMISILTDDIPTDVTNQLYSDPERASLMMLYQRCLRFIQLSAGKNGNSNLDEKAEPLCKTDGCNNDWVDEEQRIRRDIDGPE
jgi:hypothetical protein